MTEPINRRRFLKVLGVTGAGTAAVSASIGSMIQNVLPSPGLGS